MRTHVNDYGAIPLGINEPIPGDAEVFRETNRLAIQLAMDEARCNHGGEVVLGAGVYHTGGPVGYDLDEDTNVSLIVRGEGTFPTMIWSQDSGNPCFMLHTTTGNIRSFLMENLVLRGGRHNLSLHQAAYNRFNNVTFWGLGEWGLQSYLGQQNQFNNCSFAEVATAGSDSALFISCIHSSLNNCTFGESGGGIVCHASNLVVNGGTGYGAWYQGNQGYRWDTQSVVDLQLAGLAESAFTVNAGFMTISNMSFDLGRGFVTAKSTFALLIKDCRVRSGWSPSTPPGTDFAGFITFTANPGGMCDLNVTGNLFHMRSAGSAFDEGYFIKEAPGGAFKGSVFANNNLSGGSLAVMHLPSETAPSLFAEANGNICQNPVKQDGAAHIDVLPDP